MFTKQYDLVVAGGGVAGVAAALAGARRGLRTALVEKTVWFGGLATSGVIYIYLPLCDGNGKQVSCGITEELLKASLEYGPGEIPEGWESGSTKPRKSRYQVPFSPAAFVLAMDKLLEEAKVDLWVDTLVIGTTVENGRLTELLVANKSGTGKLQAACFVDATGDADLAAFSGLPCVEARNALASWTVEYKEGDCGLAPNCGVKIVGMNIDEEVIPAGISGRIVSNAVLDGRRMYRRTLEASYASGKFTRRNHFPLLVPTMADLRHTRCIEAETMLDAGMQWTHFDDSIGQVGDWRKPNSVWEIPYRALLPKGLRGMLAAGRCIGSKNDAWEVTRVIPAAALTGEAAGVAAALSVSAGCTPDELPYETLAKELADRCGFPLHF